MEPGARKSSDPIDGRRGLKRYFNEDFTVPEGVHPFMSEVAHLASTRGISQEILARMYAAQTEANEGANRDRRPAIQGGNISRHFSQSGRADRQRRLQKKVVETYSAIFDLDADYVRILMGGDPSIVHLFEGWKDVDPARAAVEASLCPDLLRPLFEPGAIDEAVRLLLIDGMWATCIKQAELFWQRHRAFAWCLYDFGPQMRGSASERGWEYDWALEIVVTDPTSACSSSMAEEYVVKWAYLIRALKREFGFDLLPHKLPQQGVRPFDLLFSDLFTALYGIVNEYDWAAIQSQMEAILVRNNVELDVIDAMRRKLQESDPWQNEWKNWKPPDD